jgi:small subunit ribosomal protein S2
MLTRKVNPKEMTVETKKLLDAGVHFGHLTRKWHPNMAPYIFMERNGIHIIDLNKTAIKLEEAVKALKVIASQGRKVLFVATKKQAKDLVASTIEEINMPYITERWPGGLLTNFVTIRKTIKKMSQIDAMKTNGVFETLSKKERLHISRQREKLEKNFGSIKDMNRLPGAIFVIDVKKEHIAVAEAQKLGIKIFGIVDTNSNPEGIDYVIPGNDDASKSINILLDYVKHGIQEGLAERKQENEEKAAAKAKAKEEKAAAEAEKSSKE